MEVLSQEYLVLFQGITDTIEHLSQEIEQLKHLQRRAEEAYINAECA